jgi:hypothetical protein
MWVIHSRTTEICFVGKVLKSNPISCGHEWFYWWIQQLEIKILHLDWGSGDCGLAHHKKKKEIMVNVLQLTNRLVGSAATAHYSCYFLRYPGNCGHRHTACRGLWDGICSCWFVTCNMWHYASFLSPPHVPPFLLLPPTPSSLGSTSNDLIHHKTRYSPISSLSGTKPTNQRQNTVAFRSIRKAVWGLTSQLTWTFRMRSPFGNLIRRHLSATLG